MPDSYLELLGKYRQKDEKTRQNEVIPEKETLNYSRLSQYLDKSGITYDTFDSLFRLSTAMDLLRSGGTRGEQEMLQTIKNGQTYLTTIGLPALIDESDNLDTFSSTLQKELMVRKELDKLPILQESYRAYSTVRQLAKRQLMMQKKMGQEREAQKVSVEKGLTDSVAGVIEDVKKYYKTMKPAEKVAAAGGIVLIAYMIMTSPTMEKVKNALWTVAKIAGAGIGMNYVVKLFSGKTALESLNDWTGSTVGSDRFWAETFRTDAEKAATLQKSVVYLGNKDFVELARKYKDAKLAGTKKIKVPGVADKDMSQEEIYLALDTFFSRYPNETTDGQRVNAEKLELKYRNATPPPFWASVVGAAMTEDGRIKMEGDLIERTIANVKEYGVRGWNGFWVTYEGTGLMRKLYLGLRGKDPSGAILKQESDKLSEQLQHEVTNDTDLPTFLEGHIANKDHVPKFKELLKKGEKDKNEPNVTFLEYKDDSIFIMSESNLDATTGSSEKAVGDMLTKTLSQAENVLKVKYPDLGDSMYRYVDYNEIRGVRVSQTSSFKLFIRMPIKGSGEYSRKSVLGAGDSSGDKAGDTFGPMDKIDYSALENWEKELIRIRFQLNVTQSGEIDKICQWYTEKYRHLNKTKKEVMRILLDYKPDMDAAIAATGVEQKLSGGSGLLGLKEPELAAIEKLDPVKWNNVEALQAHMKKNLGGYKVRLAILGDTEARAQFAKNDQKFDPAINKDSWLTDLIADYKEKCDKFMKDYEEGTATISN